MTPIPLSADVTSGGFDVLGSEHVVLLVVFLAGCVGSGVLGRRLRRRGVEPSFRRWAAAALVAFTVPLQVLQLLPGDFRLGTSLPLQVCDLAWVVAAHALLTRDRRTTSLLLYWGLTLVPQAILTPALVERFPDPRYLMFWGMHLLTVWAAVYLTVGLGERPTWRGWRSAVAVTLAWACAVMAFNAVAGTNYGYLNRRPGVATVLDALGPLAAWPSYVVVEVVVVAAVWALMTRAYAVRGSRDDRGSAARRTRPPAAPSPPGRRAAAPAAGPRG